jgi:hypothetical protein
MRVGVLVLLLVAGCAGDPRGQWGRFENDPGYGVQCDAVCMIKARPW